MTHFVEPEGKVGLKKAYESKFGYLLSLQVAHSQYLTPLCDHVCKSATWHHNTYCVSWRKRLPRATWEGGTWSLGLLPFQYFCCYCCEFAMGTTARVTCQLCQNTDNRVKSLSGRKGGRAKHTGQRHMLPVSIYSANTQICKSRGIRGGQSRQDLYRHELNQNPFLRCTMFNSIQQIKRLFEMASFKALIKQLLA